MSRAKKPTIPITGSGRHDRRSRWNGTTPEIRDLLRKAEKTPGWVVERTRGGHWRVFPANPDEHVIICANSASCYRGLKNFRASLRRAGLAV